MLPQTPSSPKLLSSLFSSPSISRFKRSRRVKFFRYGVFPNNIPTSSLFSWLRYSVGGTHLLKIINNRYHESEKCISYIFKATIKYWEKENPDEKPEGGRNIINPCVHTYHLSTGAYAPLDPLATAIFGLSYGSEWFPAPPSAKGVSACLVSGQTA